MTAPGPRREDRASLQEQGSLEEQASPVMVADYYKAWAIPSALKAWVAS